MTRIDLDIERLVLRGVPAELAEGIGSLVAERLSELATADRRGDEPPRWAAASRRVRPVTDREGLAAQVARDTWATARDRIREGVSR
ncbi:hypothetical protein ASF40_13150 [Microbacterium sp. Leaf288]|uniref:hypothetical protein n=1 Tax=Microbacterium sp. Leaf288 TaxID=1736323 RepID=UPI0006F25089|nr:hypothetical protein [Microbacterium sp. Leaf288]KQP70683.1 hypothetical protein ASF40_13150 [Microbacterium sp. Leaf288]